MYAHTCTHIQMHTAWISRPQARALGHPLLPGFTYAWRGLVPGLGGGGWEGVRGTLSLSLPSPPLQLAVLRHLQLCQGCGNAFSTIDPVHTIPNTKCWLPIMKEVKTSVCLWCSKPCPRPLTNCVTPGGVPQDAHGHPESGAEREFQFMWMGPSRPACPSPPKFLTGTPKPL